MRKGDERLKKEEMITGKDWKKEKREEIVRKKGQERDRKIR